MKFIRVGVWRINVEHITSVYQGVEYSGGAGNRGRPVLRVFTLDGRDLIQFTTEDLIDDFLNQLDALDENAPKLAIAEVGGAGRKLDQ